MGWAWHLSVTSSNGPGGIAVKLVWDGAREARSTNDMKPFTPPIQVRNSNPSKTALPSLFLKCPRTSTSGQGSIRLFSERGEESTRKGALLWKRQ